jgi:hypothetical protein
MRLVWQWSTGSGRRPVADGECHLSVGIDENRRTAFRDREHLGDVGDIHRGTPVGLPWACLLSRPCVTSDSTITSAESG